METILDYEKDIRYPTDAPPLMHAHAIDAHRHGLKHLADQMRDQEQAYPRGGGRRSGTGDLG